MSQPYYQDSSVTIYHGDCREIIPNLHHVDAAIADPPYQETRLKWDKWPVGWVDAVEKVTKSMWVFGTLRLFHDRHADFAKWKLSQDLIWEKQNGSGLLNDRFRRVHEQLAHFYRGKWSSIHHAAVVTMDAQKRNIRRQMKPAHWGQLRSAGVYAVKKGGPRLMRSVIRCKNMHRKGKHPTQKPTTILRALISYSVPEGGTVLDPMIGSGSTLIAAKETGRRAIGIDGGEEWCECAANWCQQTMELH